MDFLPEGNCFSIDFGCKELEVHYLLYNRHFRDQLETLNQLSFTFICVTLSINCMPSRFEWSVFRSALEEMELCRPREPPRRHRAPAPVLLGQAPGLGAPWHTLARTGLFCSKCEQRGDFQHCPALETNRGLEWQLVSLNVIKHKLFFK